VRSTRALNRIRHHPRKRMIQYSAAPAIDPKQRGVLDARLPAFAKASADWHCTPAKPPAQTGRGHDLAKDRP
jgi:hypothetical protein